MAIYENTTATPAAEVKNYPTETVGFAARVRSVSPQHKLGSIFYGSDNSRWIYGKASGAISFGSNANINTSTFVTTDDDGVQAEGEIVFGGNPSNGHTITLNGVAVTFVTSGATGNQVNIGGDLAATLLALKTFLNASANAEISKCTYDTDADGLLITFDAVGTAGNSFTLAASNATPSGGTLSGGEANGTIVAADGAFADGEYGWFRQVNVIT